MTDKITSIEDTTPQDRAELNVGGRKKNNKVIIIIIFLLVSVGVLATGVYVAFSNISQEPVVETPTDNNFIAGSDDSSLDDSNNYFDAIRKEKKRQDDLALIKKLKAEKAAVDKETAKLLKPKKVTRSGYTPRKVQPKPTVSRSTSSASSKDKVITPEQRKMQGNVLVSVRGSQKIPKPPKTFSKAFNASSFENGQASLRKEGSLDFLLVHGTSLPCALYSQIISDYSGFVTCRLTQDVYSANGAALLLEKGSLISGTQSVAMVLGKARIFTSWADVETPLGASIRIDSLGTGRLGAAGIEAWVDNHFKQRFGGAILLSFVDDVLGALKNKVSQRKGVGIDNSTDNASDMASKALDSSINIKPTGYAFIGQRINILVARDIDMSSIYHFEAE